MKAFMSDLNNTTHKQDMMLHAKTLQEGPGAGRCTA